MRIAQVAPLHESVPPKLYGGTERIVSWLTEALVKMGHHVTLFASGDSLTSARLQSGTPSALRLSPQSHDKNIPHFLMMEMVAKNSEDFDLIHYHFDLFQYSLARRIHVPQITTEHGRLDVPDLQPVMQEFSDLKFVSISNSQRQQLPWLNWVGTVHHGLPENLHKFQEKPGQYLAFLGRISPEKRPDRAIEIARKAGIPLKIAAKVDNADIEYFKQTIEPLLKGGGVEFIGEVNEHQKTEFLGNAAALLFPIDWPEPFGIVMIEAMACGTPVLAYPCGSVPEIIKPGVNGFLVNSIDEAVKCLKEIDTISRKICRATFEQYFTSDIMAKNYLHIYEKHLSRRERLRAVL